MSCSFHEYKQKHNRRPSWPSVQHAAAFGPFDSCGPAAWSCACAASRPVIGGVASLLSSGVYGSAQCRAGGGLGRGVRSVSLLKSERFWAKKVGWEENLSVKWAQESEVWASWRGKARLEGELGAFVGLLLLWSSGGLRLSPQLSKHIQATGLHALVAS